MKVEDWLPQLPWLGPPLPRFLGFLWTRAAAISPPEDTAGITLSNLVIEPREVYTGEWFTISVTATNYDKVSRTYTITITHTGWRQEGWPPVLTQFEWSEYKPISLEPGESKEVIVFQGNVAWAGIYKVNVNGLRSEFTVISSP